MAHTLTASWYKSSTSNYVTVNDVKVDVPYELKNGDIVKIYSSNGDSSGILINGESIGNSFNGNIALSDTDIAYTEPNWGPSIDSSGPVVTINYTEQSTPSYPKINSFTYHGKKINNINGKPIRYVHHSGNTYEMVYVVQLATPQNVTADGTTVSWDEVENATSYEILADGVSIGTTDSVTNYLLDSVGNILQDSNGNNLEFTEV